MSLCTNNLSFKLMRVAPSRITDVSSCRPVPPVNSWDAINKVSIMCNCVKTQQ
jgi:hypothetical protein